MGGANAATITCMNDFVDFFDRAMGGDDSEKGVGLHRMLCFRLYAHGKDATNSYGVGKDNLFLCRMNFSIIDIAGMESSDVRSELCAFQKEIGKALERYSSRKVYSPPK